LYNNGSSPFKVTSSSIIKFWIGAIFTSFPSRENIEKYKYSEVFLNGTIGADNWITSNTSGSKGKVSIVFSSTLWVVLAKSI
jgi:hypothetical protein